jgi:putative acetyltransferase
VLIRRESDVDIAASRRVLLAAFGSGEGSPVEVSLLDALRADKAWLPRLSIVAEVDGTVAGYVSCTRAWLDPGGVEVLGLGPIGVLPHLQRLGVGKALMHGVIAAAEALDEKLIGLLGSPDYYHRFGFRPSTEYGVRPPRADWAAYFQVRALARQDALPCGTFRYAEPFNDL